MMDFPANPTSGQIFGSGSGPLYFWDGVAWSVLISQGLTANRKNLFANPAIQVSQETGNVEGTAQGYYAADQWFDSFTASGAAFGFSRVAKVNPSGSQYRLQFRVTTAKAALGASDYVGVLQKIEGFVATDLSWASAGNQKDAVIQFGFNGPAGTYCICLRNAGTNNCCFNALFTITAAQALIDTLQVIKVPAPGPSFITWAIDNTQSIEFWIAVACGTSMIAPAVGWQAGGYIGCPGMTNGIGAIGTFQIWDIGLHPDPNKTGLPPTFEVPDFTTEQLKCQRYWYTQSFQQAGYGAAGGGEYYSLPTKASMRTQPTIIYLATTTSNCAPQVLNATTENALVFCTISAAGVYVFNGWYKLSARM